MPMRMWKDTASDLPYAEIGLGVTYSPNMVISRIVRKGYALITPYIKYSLSGVGALMIMPLILCQKKRKKRKLAQATLCLIFDEVS